VCQKLSDGEGWMNRVEELQGVVAPLGKDA
jgi:hypothetical protein